MEVDFHPIRVLHTGGGFLLGPLKKKCKQRQLPPPNQNVISFFVKTLNLRIKIYDNLSRFALFEIDRNDLGWSSKMARWKATSRGFPTGHLRGISEVVEIDCEARQKGIEVETWIEVGPPACMGLISLGGAANL